MNNKPCCKECVITKVYSEKHEYLLGKCGLDECPCHSTRYPTEEGEQQKSTGVSTPPSVSEVINSLVYEWYNRPLKMLHIEEAEMVKDLLNRVASVARKEEFRETDPIGFAEEAYQNGLKAGAAAIKERILAALPKDKTPYWVIALINFI